MNPRAGCRRQPNEIPIRMISTTQCLRYLRSRFLVLLFPFLLCLTGILGLQWVAGAFDAPFRSHSDAPAHAVTSILVRNYLADGLPAPPVEYARKLYESYPRVAIGYWPPFFYGVAGLWLLTFGVSKASFVSLYAVLGALLCVLLWESLRARVGRGGAGFAVLACILLITFSNSSTTTMLELPLALFVYAACLTLSRYIVSPVLPLSLLFALLSSAAILTKGNGFCLALLPPIAFLIAGKLRLLLTWRLWLGALLVALLTVPWFWWFATATTSHFSGRSATNYLFVAVPRYLAFLLPSYGVGLCALALLGLVVILLNSVERSRAALPPRIHLLRKSEADWAFWAAMAAAPPAFLLFHVLTPSGIEPRYWYTVLGPVCVLAACGFWCVVQVAAQKLTSAKPALRLAALLLIAVLAVDLWFSMGANRILHPKEMSDFADWALERTRILNSSVLICCGGEVEGEFIAEFAVRNPTPPPGFRILRASKSLPYLGGLRPANTAQGLAPRTHAAGHLEDLDLAMVVLLSRDSESAAREVSGARLMIEQHAEKWERLVAPSFDFFPANSPFLVYRRRETAMGSQSATPQSTP